MKFMKNLKLRKIANTLTLIRIFLGLPIIMLLSAKFYSFACFLIIIGGLTDFLDGKLARKADGGNDLGATLDPLADKILICAPFIWLSSIGALPAWSIWLLVSRELLISGWRAKKGKKGAASKLGKVKTILQFASLLLILWPERWGGIIIDRIHYFGFILFWVSLFVAIYSALKYIDFTLSTDR